MELYVDLRCLQDPRFAQRGVGHHSATLLRAGRTYFQDDCRWIGLTSQDLPELCSEYRELVDETTSLYTPYRQSQPALFLQLSPMTHSPAVMQRFLMQSGILSSVLVYDFIPLDDPGRYLGSPAALAEYTDCMAWLKHYDLYFPISQYSSRRLQELIDVPREDVQVTGVALRDEFAATYQSLDSVQSPSQIQKKDYYLFVGGGDPRKNLDTVVRAYAQLQGKQVPQLVIAGCYASRTQEETRALVAELGGSAKGLQFVQGISDAELAKLYGGAVCSICSSILEGFSLPVIEGIACGSPVLASINDAHLELVNDPESMFQPLDAQRLASLMSRMHSDPQWRQSVWNAQHPVARRFLIDHVAYRYWNKVRQAMERMARPSSQRRLAPSRPRIAVMTPFPPDRSGIADYSRRSLEEIGKLADVDVYCETAAPEMTSGVQRVLPISDLPYVSNEYDRVVSVVGNSHFHIPIIKLQMKYGGPCLIHDNRLAELYNWWKGPEEFQQMACRSVGRHVSHEECQSWMVDPGKLPSLFFDDLIDNSRPLMVHSRGIQAAIEKQYNKQAAYLPFCVYRDFPDLSLTPAAKQAARQRLGIPEDQLAIITLGILGRTKAPDSMIHAISLLRSAGHDAHLYFVGSAGGQEALVHQAVAQHKVESAVHLCSDWLDESAYTDFISAADMAVQLRNHFFGGLSGAMLDCIASGLVTIANQDLAEALDSPETVLRIGDSLRGDELAEKLLLAIDQFDLNDRITASRQDYLVRHSFERYAVEFLQTLGLSVPEHLLQQQREYQPAVSAV